MPCLFSTSIYESLILHHLLRYTTGRRQMVVLPSWSLDADAEGNTDGRTGWFYEENHRELWR